MIPREALSKRKYPFTGPDVEYIRHLETKVEELERNLRAQSQSLSNASDQSDLVFHIEDPASQAKKAATAKFKKISTEGTKIIAAFLAQTPACLSEWFRARNNAQLLTREQVLSAFRILTLCSPSISLQTPRIGPATTQFTVVKAYQKLQIFLQSLTNNLTRLENYNLLLFFCICHVARKNGMPIDDVDDFANNCLGNDCEDSRLSSIYLQRLGSTAASIARTIEQLEDKRGYPGSLLFLLCFPSMRTCKTLKDEPDTLRLLSTGIEKKTQWLLEKDAERGSVSVSFAPAFVIACIGKWTLEQVNKGLGTMLTPEQFSRRKQDVEREIALSEEATATICRMEKRRKTQHGAGVPNSSVPDKNPAFKDASSLELEAARVESERRPSSASSDLCAPTTNETLSLHGGTRTSQNGIMSPVGVSTPDHAGEAVASGNQGNADSSSGTDVDLFPLHPEQNPGLPETFGSVDINQLGTDYNMGLLVAEAWLNAEFDMGRLVTEAWSLDSSSI